MSLSYQEAANTAVVLNYGDSDQAIVAGLNTIKLPGGQRTIIEVKEFRQTSRQFAGSDSKTNLEFSGNAVFNDAGQKLLRTLYKNNTKFGWIGNTGEGGECRIYLNKNSSVLATSMLNSDFLALNYADDEDTMFQVSQYDFPSTDVDGMYPFSCGLTVGGESAIFAVHMTGTTIGFTAGSPGTITDSGSGFITAGFEAGMAIIVEGTTSNDGMYVIDTVAAGVITPVSGTTQTESSGSSFTLHGGI